MKFYKVLISFVVCAAFLVGCQEGPAEKKGKEIDNAVEKVQDKLQDKGPAQKAGEKIDDLTGNSGD
jgi:hypothetical protein